MDQSKVQAAHKRLAEINVVIAKNREKQAQAESTISLLGPDARAKLAERQLTMVGELQSGTGVFSAYSDLLDRIAEAEEDAKKREKAWADWHSFRRTAKDLEAQRENIRSTLTAAYQAKPLEIR